MALGKRKTEQQQALFVPADCLPRSPGHVFYKRLNELLAEAGFDPWVEEVCATFYADRKGREGIPPGTYFRMLLVGYFEGISSQRGIAWRCSDSLSIRKFLGIPVNKESPDHSSLSVIRERLSLEVHSRIFNWILQLAKDKKLLKGKTVAVDSTTLEANAAMKSIVRRESGEDWKEYVTRLMQEEGVVEAGTTPSDEEIRRYDKQRKNKTVSNDEWVSPTDPDSRIARMKDGTTHLAYKAEHVVDLDTGVLLAAEVYHADQSDPQTLEDSLHQAQINQESAGSEEEIRDVAADKGYHSAKTIGTLDEHTTYRTYIPEPHRKDKRRWTDKPAGQRAAVYANRRRVRGERGKRLQRLRSEFVERSFAHVCETGGARRTWLQGIEKVRKRYLLAAAAHNLGCLMRVLFQMGTPRGLQTFVDLVSSLHFAIVMLFTIPTAQYRHPARVTIGRRHRGRAGARPALPLRTIRFSTGC
jgi:transposase